MDSVWPSLCVFFSRSCLGKVPEVSGQLPRDVALECVKCGQHFRAAYGFLAAKSHERKQVKFCLAPKMHTFEE